MNSKGQSKMSRVKWTWGDKKEISLPLSLMYLTILTMVGATTAIVTTYGSTMELEAVKMPPITVPAALYVEAPATVQGASTHIIGADGYGGGPGLPEIATTLDDTTVTQNGTPDVQGNPPIEDDDTNMDIQTMIWDFSRWGRFKSPSSTAALPGFVQSAGVIIGGAIASRNNRLYGNIQALDRQQDFHP